MRRPSEGLRYLGLLSSCALLVLSVVYGTEENQGRVALVLAAAGLAVQLLGNRFALSRSARLSAHAIVGLGWVFWWPSVARKAARPAAYPYLVGGWAAVHAIAAGPLVWGEPAASASPTGVRESACDLVTGRCPEIEQQHKQEQQHDYSSDRNDDRGAPVGTTSSSSSSPSSVDAAPSSPATGTTPTAPLGPPPPSSASAISPPGSSS